MEEVNALRGREVDMRGLRPEALLRPVYVAVALQVVVACKRKGLSKMPFLSPGVPTVESCKPAYKGKTSGGVGEEGAPDRLETETRCFYATIS